MIKEGALQQFLVLAFQHIKSLDQALTDTNAELSILSQALSDLKDERLNQAVRQARKTRQRLAADSAEKPRAEVSSGEEYDQIIQRLLNGEVC